MEHCEFIIKKVETNFDIEAKGTVCELFVRRGNGCIILKLSKGINSLLLVVLLLYSEKCSYRGLYDW